MCAAVRQYTVKRMTSAKEAADAAWLGELLHQESSYRVLPYSKERAMTWALRAINTPHKVFGAVAYTVEQLPQLVGIMGAHLSELYLCEATVAADMTLYVRPEHRGTTVALRMIKMFEKWADEQGATIKMLSVSTGINTERTVKFYERLGYKASGFMTTKMEN